MQDTKQKILTLLKINGGLTTSNLGDMLDISATAVRRHLNTLEAQSLIAHRTEQRGMGRPSFIYELTAGASEVFPQSYATFATNILEDLIELEGTEKLDELFCQCLVAQLLPGAFITPVTLNHNGLSSPNKEYPFPSIT